MSKYRLAWRYRRVLWKYRGLWLTRSRCLAAALTGTVLLAAIVQRARE